LGVPSSGERHKFAPCLRACAWSIACQRRSNDATGESDALIARCQRNVIASNDNWKDSQQAAIAATGKAPPNDNESAILGLLAPGNYTAIVAGKNGTKGVALIEFYNLP